MQLINELVPEEKCVSTSRFPYIEYPFEKFNLVQSTILRNRLHKDDANLVLGTKTATGKTICAELYVAPVVEDMGKKVLYVSPLKALTAEKHEEWGKAFPDLNIAVLTSDQKTEPEQLNKKLRNADIICMTSEMLDSRTRKHAAEGTSWIWDIGLIVLDESHIICSESRGHAVEVGLMRFTRLNQDARILFLSATMPNILDFEKWLTQLNGKETHVICSDWRPHSLDWHFITEKKGNYAARKAERLDLTMNLILSKPDEKFLIFVHDKASGRALETNLERSGIETGFHNADCDYTTRKRLERGFGDPKGLRVIIATSTLAWGVNIMSPNVIIMGSKRGITDVDELDIIQEAGRAGRAGKGHCYLICDEKEKWKARVETPRNVNSVLINEGTLGFHILAEIQCGDIKNMGDLLEWFDRSLAHQQGLLNTQLLHQVLEDLMEMKMVQIEAGVFTLTPLGAISAAMYYMPNDLAWWARTFSIVSIKKLWDSDLALSWCLGGAPSYHTFTSKADQERVNEYSKALNNKMKLDHAITTSVVPCDLYNLLTGRGDAFSVRPIKYDIERITNALLLINKIRGWDKESYFESIPVRMASGVPAKLAPLCVISGVGRARAEKLYNAGFTDIDALIAKNNRMKLVKLIGQKTAKSLIDKAEKLRA